MNNILGVLYLNNMSLYAMLGSRMQQNAWNCLPVHKMAELFTYPLLKTRNKTQLKNKILRDFGDNLGDSENDQICTYEKYFLP